VKAHGRSSHVESLEKRALFSSVGLPRPDHVVVLILEDHSYNELFAAPTAASMQSWPVATPGAQTWDPNLRSLEARSASFTNARSIGNTNAVDYQALFSGLEPTGKTAVSSTAPNIASELTDAGLSFGGFADGLPSVGYTGGNVGEYSTTHNPWLPFTNFPRSDGQPFGKFPDEKWSALPTVSYVIPDQTHNMHSGQVSQADQWYQANVEPYADWAMKHNSLLIVTWDESHAANDQIPTLFYGPMVKPGQYSQPITQDNILRTIEDMYGLAPTGEAASASPLTSVFKQPAASQTPARRAAKAKAARLTGQGTAAGVHSSVFSTVPVR